MNDVLAQLAQFHFLRPWWLLALLPASAIVALLWRRKASYGAWERVISPHLLPHLMRGNQGRQSRSPLVLLLLTWLLACLALAGPTWRQLPQAAQKKIDAQVIVLDLSLSMFSKDLPPSRLIRARMKLTDILKRTDEGLTALVVFAGTPHVVTPLTDDTNTILSMVGSLSPEIMPIQGSDAVGAVQRALDVFKQGGVSSGRILLMTDGVPADFVAQLQPLITADTPVSIMGIGTKEGAPIELPDGTFVKREGGGIVVPQLAVDSLKQAARQLGGRFSTLSSSDDDINYLLANHNPFGNQEIKDARREFDVWDEAGPWLVVLLLPLAAAAYRRGWLGALALPALVPLLWLVPTPPAQAFEWSDLWKTPDQQGQTLLREGHADAAAESFAHPGWKGTSYYRAGDYEAAAEQFRQQPDADGLYNLGNALTELQQYDDAIATYEKALQLNPDNADAKTNLEIARKRKQQQQEQQENEGESGDKNQDGEQDKSDKQQKQDQQQDQQGQDQQDQDKQDDQSGENEQDDPSDQQEPGEDPQQNQPQDQPQDQGEQQDEQKEEPQPQSGDPMDEGDEQQQPVPAEPQAEPLQSEERQALEQWLRRVPDDPGGLLRRKFERESQLRKVNPGGDSTW